MGMGMIGNEDEPLNANEETFIGLDTSGDNLTQQNKPMFEVEDPNPYMQQQSNTGTSGSRSKQRKQQVDEDDWGEDELGDDLLPM